MSSQRPPAATAEQLDPVEVIADEIAAETMVGLEGLISPDDFAQLEELIAVTLAHQPEMRRMVRKIAPDPVLTASDDVPTRAAADAPDEAQRGTGSRKR